MTTATEGRIEVRRDSRGVATVVIDNAARLNALGSGLLAEFAHTLVRLEIGRAHV